MYRHIILLVLLAVAPAIHAQHTISGTITDNATGETLIGATILDTRSGKGTTSNVNGRYTLTLKESRRTLPPCASRLWAMNPSSTPSN